MPGKEENSCSAETQQRKEVRDLWRKEENLVKGSVAIVGHSVDGGASRDEELDGVYVSAARRPV